MVYSLTAATYGTDAYRGEVDRVHKLVRSNASSLLSYNALRQLDDDTADEVRRGRSIV